MSFTPKYYHVSYKAYNNPSSINSAIDSANKSVPQLAGCTQTIMVNRKQFMARSAYYSPATNRDVWGKWIDC
jgi:hypothetical protein